LAESTSLIIGVRAPDILKRILALFPLARKAVALCGCAPRRPCRSLAPHDGRPAHVNDDLAVRSSWNQPDDFWRGDDFSRIAISVRRFTAEARLRGRSRD
jgi:hypothetical protein